MPSTEDNQDRRWSALMAAAQDGDAAAYDRLLRAITPFIRSLALRTTADRDLAEDIAQDVLLTVHRVRHTYDPLRPFSPWLAAITSRRCIDALRVRARIHQHETSDDHAFETFADARANQEEDGSVIGEAQLRQWLESLPRGQREAIELLKLRELSLREASSLSGQSVGALKVGVHRAIKALRAKLTATADKA
jgi:RNA polymerase sigma-70 factor (ECF subfamily)